MDDVTDVVDLHTDRDRSPGARAEILEEDCWSRRSRSTACAASTDAVTVALDARPPTALDPQVALRPEPFGALAYHYGNRRLMFLKHPDMVARRAGPRRPPTVADALAACGIAESAWPRSSTPSTRWSDVGGRP